MHVLLRLSPSPRRAASHFCWDPHPSPVKGRFTLLLGPPSSGKTTLLKVLAGNVADGEDGLRIKGSITYTGEEFDKFQVRGGAWPMSSRGGQESGAEPTRGPTVPWSGRALELRS